MLRAASPDHRRSDIGISVVNSKVCIAVFTGHQNYDSPDFRNDVVRYCPKCSETQAEDAFMARRFFSPTEEVEIDQCLKCSRIWLDQGERHTIQKQFYTEEKRLKAADEFLAGELSLSESEIEEATKERLEEYQKIHKNRRAYLSYKKEQTEQQFLEGLRLTKQLFAELFTK